MNDTYTAAVLDEALESAAPAVVSSPKATGFMAVLHSMLARSIMILINAGTGILTARSLDPHGRGELSAMAIWPLVLTNAMTLGLPTSLTYKIRCNEGSPGNLIGAALVISLLTSVLSVIVAAAFLPQLLHLYSPEVVMYGRWFLVSAPIGITLFISRAAFEAHGDFSTSTRSQWLTSFLNLLGLVVLRLAHIFTPTTAAFIYVFGSIPLVLWMVYKLWVLYRPSLHAFKESSRSLLSYGLRSYGIDLCGTLSAYVDQAFVVSVLDAKSMGTYVVALGLSRMMNIIQFSVVMVLFPKLINRPVEDVKEMTGTATRITAMLLSSVGIFVVLFGPFLLRLLYGNAYASAAAVLRILIVEAVLGGIATVLSQAPMALGRPGIVTVLQSAGLAITIPLMLVLVPQFGMLGAAYALLLSTASRLALLIVSFRHVLGISCPRLWLSRSDVVVLSSRCSQITGRLGRSYA